MVKIYIDTSFSTRIVIILFDLIELFHAFRDNLRLSLNMSFDTYHEEVIYTVTFPSTINRPMVLSIMKLWFTGHLPLSHSPKTAVPFYPNPHTIVPNIHYTRNAGGQADRSTRYSQFYLPL